MRKYFCLFLVVVAVLGDTFVSGPVTGNWDSAGSPYLVTDTVYVPTDDTLLIAPGVDVIFQGHFPGNPIMPGVLIVEAMAQTGGVLARLSIQGEQKEENTDAVYFMSIDKVKFRRPVVPGDQIRLELKALRTGSRVWKLGGKAFVGQDLVSEAELMATVG